MQQVVIKTTRTVTVETTIVLVDVTPPALQPERTPWDEPVEPQTVIETEGWAAA